MSRKMWDEIHLLGSSCPYARLRWTCLYSFAIVTSSHMARYSPSKTHQLEAGGIDWWSGPPWLLGPNSSQFLQWYSLTHMWDIFLGTHYNDVIMSARVSQITSFTIVFSTVYSGADQRKHQSSASLAFTRGIHRWPVYSPSTKGQ